MSFSIYNAIKPAEVLYPNILQPKHIKGEKKYLNWLKTPAHKQIFAEKNEGDKNFIMSFL